MKGAETQAIRDYVSCNFGGNAGRDLGLETSRPSGLKHWSPIAEMIYGG